MGSVAWDMYGFYPPTAKWTEMPSELEYWMHQLPDEWATRDKYRTGGDLENELFASMVKLYDRY